MLSNIGKAIIAGVMILSFSAASRGQVFYSQPDSIDPLQPDIGEFLNTNLAEIAGQGDKYYSDGDYSRAAAYYLFTLHYDINDERLIYNLACCYALMGKADLAAQYLRLAVQKGFNNFAFITNDSDFNHVKSRPEFAVVYDSIMAAARHPDQAGAEVIYLKNDALFKCLVKLPENFDKAKSYKLVIGIHGYGGEAGNFLKIWDSIKQPDFIYACSYAPYHFLLNGRIAYSWDLWLPGEQEFPGPDFQITEDYIANVVKELKSRFNISGVYLLGHSQGASTSYVTGIERHQLFDGIVAIAGSLNTYWLSDSTLDAGNDLKVLIVHGKHDKTFRFVEAISARRLLERHGYDVTLIEHDGTHALPDNHIMNEIADWIARCPQKIHKK